MHACLEQKSCSIFQTAELLQSLIGRVRGGGGGATNVQARLPASAFNDTNLPAGLDQHKAIATQPGLC